MPEAFPEPPDPDEPLTVGILYNLKKGILSEAPDAEAEYDNPETIDAIRSVLEQAGVAVQTLEADTRLLQNLQSKRIDIAFNIAEGSGGRGREAQIPAILNLYGIPFTGSDETTLCLALDKALTKRFLRTYRIRTPNYLVIENGRIPDGGRLRYPVIVKPNAEGSSKGIPQTSVAANRAELRRLAEETAKLYGQAALAEEYIEGREFTVGIIGNGPETFVFPPMELLYQKPTQGSYHVYSYHVKQNYNAYLHYQCPAALDEKKEKEITDTALLIYRALGCRDLARIDFRMSADGLLYFIEINPLPGLAPHYSDYPMLAEFCGVGYGELILRILNCALKRYGLKQVGGGKPDGTL